MFAIGIILAVIMIVNIFIAVRYWKNGKIRYKIEKVPFSREIAEEVLINIERGYYTRYSYRVPTKEILEWIDRFEDKTDETTLKMIRNYTQHKRNNVVLSYKVDLLESVVKSERKKYDELAKKSAEHIQHLQTIIRGE